MILESADPRMALVARPAAKLLGDVLAGNDPAADVAVGTLEDSVESEHFAPRFTAGDLGASRASHSTSRHLRDAAHILFTSGSTGTPKGVVIEHRNAIHFVEWGAAYFGYGEQDRISGILRFISTSRPSTSTERCTRARAPPCSGGRQPAAARSSPS